MADPTRREILHMLRKEEMSAGDIAAQFDITNRQYHLTLRC
jgi:ArsR family transcriptional regulator